MSGDTWTPPRLTEMSVVDVLSRWRPGSHDTSDTPAGANLAWGWTEEAHDLSTRTSEYQAGIVDRVYREGISFLDEAGAPILLGSDGRVWDGHHRLCAALTLGIATVKVDIVAPGSTP